MFFEYKLRVNSRDVDGHNHARPSAVLGLLQEAATLAAAELHVSHDETVEKYNAFWMLARVWYRLNRPLAFDETLTVRTWHRGGRGASMYRDFDLYVDGEQVGEAVSVWVLADMDSHKLLRFSVMEECQEETAGGALCKSVQLSNLKLPDGLPVAERRTMRYSDTDINSHVNNARYADFVCDVLHLETAGEGKFVSSLQLCYHAECRPGEELLLSVGELNGGRCVAGKDGEDKLRFSALLTLKDLT